MGKILKLLGVLFLLLIVGIVALLVWAHKSGADKQAVFFAAVYSGNPEEVLALCDPRMTDEMDTPVLATWMRVFEQRHGNFKGLSPSNFSTNESIENGVGIVRAEGTVDFENGSAESLLVYHDDKIVEWSVASDMMGDDWFEGPDDTTFYRQRAEAVLTCLLTNEPAKAHAMFSESLKLGSSMAETTDVCERANEILGEFESLTFKDEKYEVTDEGRYLIVRYAITAENGDAVGSVHFRFLGWKSHLDEFNIGSE